MRRRRSGIAARPGGACSKGRSAGPCWGPRATARRPSPSTCRISTRGGGGAAPCRRVRRPARRRAAGGARGRRRHGLCPGLMYWQRRHRFCGVCGSACIAAQAGHVRRCANPECAADHFPRTDPAVIVLVTRGDRCLLGRQRHWRPGMRSTLAGFVEPGESLEEAVVREVREESGAVLRDPIYQSSQPGRFPPRSCSASAPKPKASRSTSTGASSTMPAGMRAAGCAPRGRRRFPPPASRFDSAPSHRRLACGRRRRKRARRAIKDAT